MENCFTSSYLNVFLIVPECTSSIFWLSLECKHSKPKPTTSMIIYETSYKGSATIQENILFSVSSVSTSGLKAKK